MQIKVPRRTKHRQHEVVAFLFYLAAVSVFARVFFLNLLFIKSYIDSMFFVQWKQKLRAQKHMAIVVLHRTFGRAGMNDKRPS